MSWQWILMLILGVFQILGWAVYFKFVRRSPADKRMARLVVTNLDGDLMAALKERAAMHHHSVEEEHRSILREALREPGTRSFSETLASMPDVGADTDFVSTERQ